MITSIKENKTLVTHTSSTTISHPVPYGLAAADLDLSFNRSNNQ
jgi:hypothetical protein